jgi:hypothetical protein
MTRGRSELEKAFLDDHRHLTRGLSRLLEALRRNDVAEARQVADELDRVAGPHIEFEEETFYPQIGRAIGASNLDRLYEEHQVGLHAVDTLRRRDPGHPLEPAERDTLVEEVQVALDHAVSCATLLSHLGDLDEKRQRELLDRLHDARRRGRRWSELPRPHDVRSKE